MPSPVKLFDWGKWANITQDPNTGAVTVGNPYTNRTPWYNQTDFSFDQSYKIGEAKTINFQSTFTNLFNQHSVTALFSQVDSSYSGTQYITPGGQAIFDGIPFYAAATHPYDVQASLNGTPIGGQPSNSLGGPETINSQYGKPLYWQHPRTIRLQASFTF